MRRLTALLALLSGCTVHVFQEPVTLATRPLPTVAQGPRVSARSCSRITLAVVPLAIGRAEHAFHEALAEAPGSDTLADWVMVSDVVQVAGSILYAHECVTVEGTAVKASDAFAPTAPRVR